MALLVFFLRYCCRQEIHSGFYFTPLHCFNVWLLESVPIQTNWKFDRERMGHFIYVYIRIIHIFTILMEFHPYGISCLPVDSFRGDNKPSRYT